MKQVPRKIQYRCLNRSISGLEQKVTLYNVVLSSLRWGVICAMLSILTILGVVFLNYFPSSQLVTCIQQVLVGVTTSILAILFNYVSIVVKTFFAVLEVNKKQAILATSDENQRFFQNVRNDTRMPLSGKIESQSLRKV